MEDKFILAVKRAKKYGGKIFKQLEWEKWIRDGGEPPQEFLDYTFIRWCELTGEN